MRNPMLATTSLYCPKHTLLTLVVQEHSFGTSTSDCRDHVARLARSEVAIL